MAYLQCNRDGETEVDEEEAIDFIANAFRISKEAAKALLPEPGEQIACYRFDSYIKREGSE